jgi:hypothetical protein
VALYIYPLGFSSLSVTVVNKATLAEALALYVKPDVLDGDNKVKMTGCKHKVTAIFSNGCIL